MRITKEQRAKIEKINDTVKDLDPLLKERIIDYELLKLLGDDYLQIAQLLKVKGHEKPTIGEHKIEKAIAGAPIQKPLKGTPDLREFFNEKKPRVETEKVTVFGFYLEHYKNVPEFSKADISKCYFEARERKPKVIGQVLRDTKNAKGYLVEGSKRGKFRLSNIGENLVIHDLPREKNK